MPRPMHPPKKAPDTMFDLQLPAHHSLMGLLAKEDNHDVPRVTQCSAGRVMYALLVDLQQTLRGDQAYVAHRCTLRH